MNKLAKVLGVILGLGVVSTALFLLFGNGFVSGDEDDNVMEFEIDDGTLVKYNGSDSSVTIPEGVTAIGDEAFANNSSVNTVTIPEGVTSIGYGAFQNTGLTSIDIPDSVTDIASSAFANDTNLTDVSFGAGVTDLGYGVFSGCSRLSDIDIDPGNSNFMTLNGVLYNGNMTKLYEALPGGNLTSFTVPSTVLTMNPYAFYDYDTLASVTTGTGMNTIPSYAFCECDNLLTATIPGGTDEIEMKAFAGDDTLAQVYIPKSVLTIHSTAFDDCPNLAILGTNESYAEAYADQNNIAFITSPIYDVNIYDATVQTAQIDTQETEDTTSTDDTTTTRPDSGLSEDGTFTTLVVGDGAVILIDNTSMDVEHGVNTRDDDYTSSSEIPAQSYWGDTSLTEYEIDKMVTTIGTLAFARSGLTSIAIPENVSTIEDYAFYHCDDLADVEIADSVSYIGKDVFAYTAWMESFMNGENAAGSAEDEDAFEIDNDSQYLIAGDGILIAYRGTQSVLTIPEGVKRIAPATFEGNELITEVNFPSTLIEIGESAFENCSSLSKVNGLTSSVSIGNGAFSGTLVSYN